MAPDITISADPIDLDKENADFARANKMAGGIVTFAGQVREMSGDTETDRLILDHYPELTTREITIIAKDACMRWNIEALRIAHRVGEMAPGEAIVFVAAASAHRRDAFEAVDFVMDYLKSGAPFWKKEKTKSGERWIEPRDQDKTDKARWSAKNSSKEK